MTHLPARRKPSPNQRDAVCFDLDGVLINSMSLHATAWQHAVTQHGLRVSRRMIYEREGEPGTVTARALLMRHHCNASPGAIRALLDDKERRFSRFASRLRVNAHLQRLLPILSKRGVRLALVTGTSAREVHRMVPNAVLAEFDAIITGDRVRHGKPHPEPYRRAFRALGISPQAAIVVENSPYGIRAARLARAHLVIGLTSSLPKRFLHEAHRTVSSIPQLCRLLTTLTASD